MSGKLTEGFRDILELRWSEFRELEKDPAGDNFTSIITTIARAASKGELRAIQTALDRLDGKVVQEIEVEMPKFIYRYPLAEKAADDPSIIDDTEQKAIPKGHDGIYQTTQFPQEYPLGAPADMDELAATEDELPTGSLRVVLEKMLNSPKQIVVDILASAKAIDEGLAGNGDPMVKSVIVAGLMSLVHKGRLSAVFEVFDQIDGKVAEKYKVLGNDVYITRFDKIAPAGAVKNADGVYELSATAVTDIWVKRLEQNNKRGR